MTKVSTIARPSSAKRAQVLVQIPRNRLGKLNRRWQSKRRPAKSTKIVKKKFVDRDGYPHVPILVLKLDRNHKSQDDTLTSENGDDSSGDSDYEDVDVGKTTHYKKQIIKKHSRASRETPADNTDESASYRPQNADQELQSHQIERDLGYINSQSNNEKGNTANTSPAGVSTGATPSNKEELSMPGEVKPKIVVLENTMIAAPLRHTQNCIVPDQSTVKVTSPELNRTITTIGKHVLPTAMIPQHQYSRLAMPLNNSLNSSQVNPNPDTIRKEVNKTANYPNVAAQMDSNNVAISTVVNNPQQEHPMDASKQSASVVRRKKSVPIRRRPTLTEDHENKTVQDALKEQNQKLYTKHNGLELLSMVCTATTASNPVDINPQLHDTTTVNSDHRHQRLEPSQEYIPRSLPNVERHEEKFKATPTHVIPNSDCQIKRPVISPMLNKVTSPHQARMISGKCFDNDTNHRYPAFNGNPSMQHLNPHVGGVGTHHFNHQLHTLPQGQQQYDPHHLISRANQQNGKQVKDARSQPPPPYYNQHQIISTSSVSGETYTVNTHRNPLSLEIAGNAHTNQTAQHLPQFARDVNVHPSLAEHLHHQYLHRIMPPSYDRNVHPPSLRETTPNMEFRQSQYSQQIPHQQSSPIHTMPSPVQNTISPKEPWQFQYPKNTTYLDSNNLNEIDRNETCTLYYESQDGKGQTECTKQTIIYRETPETQINSREKAVVHPKQNSDQKERPTDANCSKMLTMADVLAAGENEKLVKKLLLYFMPQQLLQMIIEVLGEKIENKSNKSGCDDQSNNTSKSSSVQEQSDRITTPTVIKENPLVSTPPIEKTFSHRIENFINPPPSKDAVSQEPSPSNDAVNLHTSHSNERRENNGRHSQIGATHCASNSNDQTTLLNISPEKLKATLRVIIEANADVLKNKDAVLGQSNSEASWTRPIDEQSENVGGSSSSSNVNTPASNDSNELKKTNNTNQITAVPTSEGVKTTSVPVSVSELTSTPQEANSTTNAGEKASPNASSETSLGSIDNMVEPNRRSSMDGTNGNTPNLGAVNSTRKGSDPALTQSNNNSNEKLSIKSEISQSHDLRDLNHNFPFDIQFGPNDTVESMFARIMPSCFMILTLIQEMQNVDHVNWWPVDTEGNLFKIKMSLRGISIFLRRSKKLAAHLDPCVHHFFLFLLECLGTFRERVRKILETGHSLKENYISTSEGDIYKDVFIQLYDYLCCTRVTGFLNLRTRPEVPLTPKKESVSSDDGDDVFAGGSEFSNIHQKHMVIIEKIKQRKIAEEQKNENYKKFISRLVEHSEDSVFPSTDDASNEDTNMESLEGNTRPNAENVGNNLNVTSKFSTQISVREDLGELEKTNTKRKVELIVIDSDSDEDTTPSVAKKTQNKDYFQQLPTRRITGSRSSYTIANIIDLDDEEVSENRSPESNHKRRCSDAEEEASKRLCNEQNVRPNIQSSTRNCSNEENLEYELMDVKPQKEVIDNTIDSKLQLGDAMRKAGITDELIKFQNEVPTATHTVLTVEAIKTEIKRENEEAPPDEDQPRDEQTPQIIAEEDCSTNHEESPKATDGNDCSNSSVSASNTESIETIEAIQNFLRETNAEEQLRREVIRPDNIEKPVCTTLHKNDSNASSKEAISNGALVPAISCSSENRLVGIATPNVKDDTINKKSILNAPEQIQTLNANPNKRKIEKIDLNDNSASELLRIMSQERSEKSENGGRAATQKLLSFRKPLRKIQNNDEISNVSIPAPEKRQESVINRGNQFKPDEEKVNSPSEDKAATSVITERRNSAEINVPVKVPNSPENHKHFTADHKISSPPVVRNHSEIFQYKSKPVEAEISNRNTERRIVSPTSNSASSYTSQSNYDRTVGNPSNKVGRCPVIEHHTKAVAGECFKTPDIPCRYAVPPGPKPQNVTNFKHTAVIATSSAELPRKEHKEHNVEPSKPHRPANSKELLRQAVTQKRLIHNMMQHPPVSSPERHNNRIQPPLTTIPSLQSIYNESVNTNGFISQTIKDEIGVLSKKESLGPSEYVQEITTLLRLPMIPKDFKDFYIFVTKQQILQFHQPIAFYIFLELLNQSGLKDYHKKFTEYTKKKFEDRVNSKRRDDVRRQGQFRHKT